MSVVEFLYYERVETILLVDFPCFIRTKLKKKKKRENYVERTGKDLLPLFTIVNKDDWHQR
jgi:hypothetical protein